MLPEVIVGAIEYRSVQGQDGVQRMPVDSKTSIRHLVTRVPDTRL